MRGHSRSHDERKPYSLPLLWLSLASRASNSCTRAANPARCSRACSYPSRRRAFSAFSAAFSSSSVMRPYYAYTTSPPILSRSLSFLDALRPPVKAGGGADLLGVALQLGAAGELSVFEFLDRDEVPIDQDRVGERPQVLGRLQLGGGRGQKEQMHMLGHAQLDAGRFPARPIEHQHKLLGGTGPRLACECGELHFKDGNADGRGQMEAGPTRGGVDKGDQRAPGEAMRHAGNGPVSHRGPDAP